MATDKSENYLYEQHSGHVFSSNFPASVTHFTLSNKSNTIFNPANRQIILQLPILKPAPSCRVALSPSFSLSILNVIHKLQKADSKYMNISTPDKCISSVCLQIVC